MKLNFLVCIYKIVNLFIILQIDKYIAKRRAQSLRDQDQMYDEFSPSGPITDHNAYLYNDSYATNGQFLDILHVSF